MFATLCCGLLALSAAEDAVNRAEIRRLHTEVNNFLSRCPSRYDLELLEEFARLVRSELHGVVELQQDFVQNATRCRIVRLDRLIDRLSQIRWFRIYWDVEVWEWTQPLSWLDSYAQLRAAFPDDEWLSPKFLLE